MVYFSHFFIANASLLNLNNLSINRSDYCTPYTNDFSLNQRDIDSCYTLKQLRIKNIKKYILLKICRQTDKKARMDIYINTYARVHKYIQPYEESAPLYTYDAYSASGCSIHQSIKRRAMLNLRGISGRLSRRKKAPQLNSSSCSFSSPPA